MKEIYHANQAAADYVNSIKYNTKLNDILRLIRSCANNGGTCLLVPTYDIEEATIENLLRLGYCVRFMNNHYRISWDTSEILEEVISSVIDGIADRIAGQVKAELLRMKGV